MAKASQARRAIEIVEALANIHTIRYYDGYPECALCAGIAGVALDFIHEPDCPYRLAVELVQEMESE